MKFQSKNLLAIEASTNHASVALKIADHFYIETVDAVAFHAQSILPTIERLIHQANCTLSELDGVIFGQGPGSFTGLRIACSIAKGLAYANDLPLYGVSGLAAIAHQVKTDLPILCMMDARMNQVYWTLFSEEFTEEKVTSAEMIQIPGNFPIVLAGVDFETYQMQFTSELRERIIDEKTVYPESKAMIELVQQNTISPLDVAMAAPVYIRNHVTSGAPRG